MDLVVLTRAEIEDITRDAARRAVDTLVARTPKVRPACVTASQAADMLGVSKATISRRIREGKIKRNNLGMISMGEIDRILEESHG